MTRSPSALLLSGLCVLLGACSAYEPAPIDDDAALDNRPVAHCGASVRDFGGTGGRFNDDPVTQIMACTKTYKDAVQALAQKQKNMCDENVGWGATLVSEKSQLLGRDAGYRAIVNRNCGGLQIWFSPLAQVTEGGDNVATDVEVIAFDANKQAFNYYALEGGRWFYHGDSFDMIEGPLADGAQRRCAACHTGGGLVMKEHKLPWMNWSNFSLENPGSTEIIADIGRKLGLGNSLQKFDGRTMQEDFVDPINVNEWNKSRMQRLFEKLKPSDAAATRALLRPAFCTVEMDLATSQLSGQAPINFIPASFLLDELLSDGSPINIDPASYSSAIAEAGQQVAGASTSDHIVRETAFSFAYTERSVSDLSYTGRLLGISPDGATLVRAAALADFTRPVFSGGMPGLAPGRCELLALAPGVAPGEPEEVMTRIKAGFIAALTAKPSLTAIEAQFLDALQHPPLFTPQTPVPPAVQAFNTACAARSSTDPAGFAKDIVRIASVNRRLANRLAIVEAPDFLFPTSDLTDGVELRLDPITCVAR